MKKNIFKVTRLLILAFVIFTAFTNGEVFESKVSNNNINKTVNLSTMAKKITEFDYDMLYSAKDTYTGDLTGYAYNCPACTGYLACNDKYDVMDGTVTYPDPTYGIVKIVASSSNLACGTIIRFNSARVSDEPVYAIVLDRGVLGNAIDLLTPNEDYASKNIGRSSITYDVLRSGW